MAFVFCFCLTLMSDEIPPQGINLVRNGLFNDPSGSLAFWAARTGGLGSMSVVPAKEAGTSGVFTSKIKELSPKPWTAELLQRFDTVIPKATVVYISFDYKISQGYSFNFYWQEERSPWPKLLSLHIDSPTDTWHRVQMAVPVHEDFQPLTTAFSFHLAEKVGICELRNISAIMLPAGTNPETLNTNAAPVLGGDFYDKDWRELATNKLEKNRKIPLTVKIMRKGKQAVPNAEVSIRQKSRSFAFGSETTFPIFSTDALNAKENAHLKKKFAPFAKQLTEYKKLILDKSKFDFVTFTDGMIWRDYEIWGNKFDEAIVKEVLAAGMTVRGHALYVPAFMFAPIPCRKMDIETLDKALMGHASKLTKKHIDNILEWNVLHGGIDYSEIYNFVGVDSLLQVFATAKASAPKAKLLISDLQGLSALSDIPLKDGIELAEWLIQNGAAVDGIVLGANMKRLDVGPQSMEKRIDLVASRLRIPIHIANFAVNGESDDFQAAIISDYMLLFYSHNAVQSVSFAESWAPALLNPKMALYNDDLSPRPAAKMVNSLLTKQWVTNFTDKTNEEGIVSCNAFWGEYDIEVKSKNGNIKLSLDLNQYREMHKGPAKLQGGTIMRNKDGLILTLTAK